MRLYLCLVLVCLEGSDVPWFHGTFNAFSIRVVCVESLLLITLMCFCICFAGKVSNLKCRRLWRIYADVTHEGHWRSIVPLTDRRWWRSIRGLGIWKKLWKYWLCVGLQKDQWSVGWSTNHPRKMSIWLENVPIPDVEGKISITTQEASMYIRSIDGPCCWFVDWIW